MEEWDSKQKQDPEFAIKLLETLSQLRLYTRLAIKIHESKLHSESSSSSEFHTKEKGDFFPKNFHKSQNLPSKQRTDLQTSSKFCYKDNLTTKLSSFKGRKTFVSKNDEPKTSLDGHSANGIEINNNKEGEPIRKNHAITKNSTREKNYSTQKPRPSPSERILNKKDERSNGSPSSSFNHSSRYSFERERQFVGNESSNSSNHNHHDHSQSDEIVSHKFYHLPPRARQWKTNNYPRNPNLSGTMSSSSKEREYNPNANPNPNAETFHHSSRSPHHRGEASSSSSSEFHTKENEDFPPKNFHRYRNSPSKQTTEWQAPCNYSYKDNLDTKPSSFKGQKSFDSIDDVPETLLDGQSANGIEINNNNNKGGEPIRKDSPIKRLFTFCEKIGPIQKPRPSFSERTLHKEDERLDGTSSSSSFPNSSTYSFKRDGQFAVNESSNASYNNHHEHFQSDEIISHRFNSRPPRLRKCINPNNTKPSYYPDNSNPSGTGSDYRKKREYDDDLGLNSKPFHSSSKY